MINSALLRYDGGKGLPPPLGRRYIDAMVFWLCVLFLSKMEMTEEKRKFKYQMPRMDTLWLLFGMQS